MNTMVATPARPAAPLQPLVAGYVGSVIALGLAAFVPVIGQLPGANPAVIVAWTLACLVGELFHMPTPTRRGQISMATPFHLAMAMVLSPVEFLPAIWISRVTVKGLIQQQPWYRVLFNAAQVTLAVCVAWVIWQWPDSINTQWTRAGHWDARVVGSASLAFLAAGAAYYLVNTLAVSAVIALTGGGRWLEAWRTNYGYAVEILSTVALLLLAPAVAASVAMFGLFGLAILMAPVAAIHAAGRSFRRLEQDREEIIESERLSAKSEIATQVGFQMTRALTSISGGIQLLAMRRPDLSDAEFRRRVDDIRHTIDEIGTLSRGLTEFSRGSFSPDWIDPATIISRSLAFLKSEGRLSGVRVETVVESPEQATFVDAVQMQMLMINLLRNCAEAIEKSHTHPGWIWVRVRRDRARHAVEFLVEDNGPGLPPGREGRIFEPGFNTRSGRPNLGLSTVHRIVRNHDGSIEATTRPGGGTRIRVILPAPSHREN